MCMHTYTHALVHMHTHTDVHRHMHTMIIVIMKLYSTQTSNLKIELSALYRIQIHMHTCMHTHSHAHTDIHTGCFWPVTDDLSTLT